MLQHYLSLGVKAVFVENMALAFFLGMCSFLAVTKKVETALGLGLAVVVVHGPDHADQQPALRLRAARRARWPGPTRRSPRSTSRSSTSSPSSGRSPRWCRSSRWRSTATLPTLYTALGVFLPLIAVNCAILGGSLFMVERDYTLGESTVFGLGSGLGFLLAIVALAAIREKLKYSNVPPGLRGLGITFLVTGLMAIAFMLFSGIQL